MPTPAAAADPRVPPLPSPSVPPSGLQTGRTGASWMELVLSASTDIELKPRHLQEHLLSIFKAIVSCCRMWAEVAWVVRQSPLPCPPSMLSPCGRAEVRPGGGRMSTCLSFARASQSFVVSGGLWWPGSSLRELPTLPRWEFFPGQSLTHPHASFATWDIGEREKQRPEARCAVGTWEGNTQSSSVAVGRRGWWWWWWWYKYFGQIY